jgi:hypothetical protein
MELWLESRCQGCSHSCGACMLAKSAKTPKLQASLPFPVANIRHRPTRLFSCLPNLICPNALATL